MNEFSAIMKDRQQGNRNEYFTALGISRYGGVLPVSAQKLCKNTIDLCGVLCENMIGKTQCYFLNKEMKCNTM
jgi:hypothetical protein